MKRLWKFWAEWWPPIVMVAFLVFAVLVISSMLNSDEPIIETAYQCDYIYNIGWWFPDHPKYIFEVGPVRMTGEEFANVCLEGQ